jgi:hypothetical protein
VFPFDVEVMEALQAPCTTMNQVAKSNALHAIENALSWMIMAQLIR